MFMCLGFMGINAFSYFFAQMYPEKVEDQGTTIDSLQRMNLFQFFFFGFLWFALFQADG